MLPVQQLEGGGLPIASVPPYTCSSLIMVCFWSMKSHLRGVAETHTISGQDKNSNTRFSSSYTGRYLV